MSIPKQDIATTYENLPLGFEGNLTYIDYLLHVAENSQHLPESVQQEMINYIYSL